MQFLIFRIYAPLAAWGDMAVGELRATLHAPGHSAILGMIAASLGIKREAEADLLKLNSSLGAALKLYSQSHLMEDFHTVQNTSRPAVWQQTRKDELQITEGRQRGKQNTPGTILTYREYLTNHITIVALYEKQKSVYSLEQIRDSLKTPVFQLYAGRKSCPLGAPPEPKIIEADTLLDAFNQTTFSPLILCYKDDSFNARREQQLFDTETVQYLWEADCPSGLKATSDCRMNDHLLCRKRWQFEPESVYTTTQKQGGA